MASNFGPKSGSSGSLNRRGRQKKIQLPDDVGRSPKGSGRPARAASSSASDGQRKPAGASSRAAKMSPPPGAKRKSIADKTKPKAPKEQKRSRSSSAPVPGAQGSPAGKMTKEERKLAKLQAKNERLAARNQDAPSATRPESSARRVGDIRAQERAERNRQRYRSYIIKIAIVVAIVVGLLFGGIFLYRSDFLLVTKVQVKGASHLTDQEITQTAAVPVDSTLLRLDTAGIVQRLEGNAWVQSASVSRVFPDTVELDIVERTPAAVVAISSKEVWVVSTDGAWLSTATESDWTNNKHIVDVSSSLANPIAGSACNDGGIENAVNILGGVSDELKNQITSISAESAAKTVLNLNDGVMVAFGDSSDIDLKEADIWALLQKYSGTISYINVRVPSRPTYRTLADKTG